MLISGLFGSPKADQRLASSLVRSHTMLNKVVSGFVQVSSHFDIQFGVQSVSLEQGAEALDKLSNAFSHESTPSAGMVSTRVMTLDSLSQ